jgi:hypothetical protein
MPRKKKAKKKPENLFIGGLEIAIQEQARKKSLADKFWAIVDRLAEFVAGFANGKK